MKVIFLDIDGVLNTSASWKISYSLNEKNIKMFSLFAKKHHASIVLISSWRKGFFASCKKMETPQIRKLESLFFKYGLQIHDRTKDLGDRRTEILQYLKEHDVSSYVILDDDISEYKGSMLGLYLVNPKVGFSKEDVKKIKWVKGMVL